jgi:hypothetical protein
LSYEPGSNTELDRFAVLQERLPEQFRRLFPDQGKARTVVVVPSLSFDAAELAKISGVNHYEERMLFMLMLLRLPRANLIYLTSQTVAPTVIDYFLHLLPGVPGEHARRRLKMLSCHDASTVPLTRKILDRPRLIQTIREAIPDRKAAHIACFCATDLERSLAVQLGIPLYGSDPALGYLGSKSGSRKVFEQAGILHPDGYRDLRDRADIVASLVALKKRSPDLSKAVIKLNEGFSGEGNAVFSYSDAPVGDGLESWVERELPVRARFEAEGEAWDDYLTKFEGMQGIVEAFVEGQGKCSPSVQYRISPIGKPHLVSTHDQVLGGPNGQVFLGCRFPAADDYRREIQEAGLKVGEVLAEQGALGRFGIDFVSVPDGAGWRHYAIEINLRKGGTTHTFMILQFLTDGLCDLETGIYRTPTGQERCYYASDNLQNDSYIGLMPHDLIDIAVCNRLHFDSATQKGVVFHLIGALSEFGKLGLVCVGEDCVEARRMYDETVAVLDRETDADK